MKKVFSAIIVLMLVFTVFPQTALAKTSVSSMSLNAKTTYMKVGKTKTFKCTVKPSNASNKAVTWSSSDKSIATVSSKGVVKAIGVGTVKIKATAKDGSKKSATCTVKVVKKVNPQDVAKSLVSTASKYLGKTGKQMGYSTAWCAYFVGRCAKETGIPENVIPNNTGLVKTLWDTMKKTSKVYYVKDYKSGAYEPKVGDLVFLDTYKPLGHIGIISVVYEEDGSFDTIDGNVATSSTDPKNTFVYELEYSRNTVINGNGSSKVNSFIRPNYSKAAD